MIEVKNLTKSYILKNKRNIVFKNINFNVKRGESIGLIGGNGAGKSTLLRILGGLDYADSGTIERNCSISWPVGISAGFQGSLSARENITFLTKIYSEEIPKKDIQKKIKSVEDFADIGESFDAPTNTYSSGMKGRVAFGMSLIFNFDVYLLDEVTAKGDIVFKKKCKKAIDEMKKKSSFIIASHSLNSLKLYADKAIVIYNKRIKEFTNVVEAFEFHKEILNKKK